MKPLMTRKGKPSGKRHWARAVSVGLLAACVTSVVWGQELEPLGNANFSTEIRNNPSGYFELKENVYLNESENGQLRSPWQPFPSFSGTLEGDGHVIYGLNIQEDNHNVNSGLFRDQSGEVRNFVFIDPEVVANGNGVYQGLVAGENNGNVTGIVWQGGQMSNMGTRTGSPGNYRYPALGVVGKSLIGGRVETMAQSVSQTVTGNHGTRVGIGAGLNVAGTVQVVAQGVNQTATGNGSNVGIGAGWNEETAQSIGGTVQVVAQGVEQTATGNNPIIGIGTAWNEGTVQVVAQGVNQTATGNNPIIGIGAGQNRETVQVVAQGVSQTVTEDNGYIGIGAGTSNDNSQAVAHDVTQLGDNTGIGIGAGFEGTRSRTHRTQGVAINEPPIKDYDRFFTEAEAKRLNLTELGLTINQQDWIAGNTTQYPMLVDLDGGYQDMQRLSPEFKQAMRDYAPPSDNPDASWFGPSIWRALERLTGVTGPGSSSTDTPAATTESITAPSPTTTAESPSSSTQDTTHSPDRASTETPRMTTETTTPTPSVEPPVGNCPAPVGSPVFQAYDHENQWLYVVIKPSLASRDLVLARYHGTVLDEQFGQCGKVAYGPPSNLPNIFNGYSVTAGLLQQDSTDTHIYLLATNQGRELQLFDLSLSEAGSNRPQFTAHRRDIGRGSVAQANAVISHNGQLYVTGNSDSQVLMGRYRALTLDDFTHEALHNEREQGNALALSLDGAHLYVAGVRDLVAPYSVFLRKYDRSTLTVDTAFAVGGEQGVIETDRYASQQAVAIYRGWVYVAASNAWGNQLFIRRYDPENGMMDGSFAVDETLPDALSNSREGVARVVLFADEQYLHLLKYDREGHIFAATYDGQREVHRIAKNPHFLRVASSGLAMTDGKVYLAFEHSGGVGGIGAIEVVDVDMPFLSINTGQSGASDGVPGWGWGLIGTTAAAVTAVAITSVVAIGYYLTRHSKKTVELPKMEAVRNSWSGDVEVGSVPIIPTPNGFLLPLSERNTMRP